MCSTSRRKLHEIAAYLNLVPPPPPADAPEAPPGPREGGGALSAELLLELLVSRHERRPSQLQALNEMPLYPTDEIIWNENVVPLEYQSTGDSITGR